jgi:hypothetical protein
MARASSYDWQIGAHKFISAVTPELPYERAFARILKDQIDNSQEPGDQSFDGLWVRSQTDWSAGAGYRYMEPISTDPIPRTYAWSYGVDPFTDPGNLVLYHQAEMVYQGGAAPEITIAGGYAWFSDGQGLYAEVIADLNLNAPPTAVKTFAQDITALVSAQGMCVAFTDGDGIWNCQKNSQTQTYNTPLASKGWFVKDRLVFATAGRLYVEPVTPAAPPVAVTGLTPVMEKTEVGWSWVDVTQGPNAIYVAGSGSEFSGIYMLTVEADGTVPVLTYPAEVAQMPLGEKIVSIDAYLGSYLLIGTNLGVRLGLIGNNGDITYGPLLTDCPPITGGFTFYSKYAFAPIEDAGEGRSGVVQIDLSEVTSEQKVAWCMAQRLPVIGAEVTRSFVYAHESLLLGATDGGLYKTSPDQGRETSGVLQSGWIRMGATVEKNWRRVATAISSQSEGAVTAYLVSESVNHEIGTLVAPNTKTSWTVSGVPPSPRIAVRLVLHDGALPPDPGTPPEPPPLPGDPIPGPPPEEGEQSWATMLAYTWQSTKGSFAAWSALAKDKGQLGTGGTTQPAGGGEPLPETTVVVSSGSDKTPIVESWSLRATPAVPRDELMRINLLCFDRELDQHGQANGRQGDAVVRYTALVEDLKTGEAFTLTDLNNNLSWEVSMEECSFKQVAPPERAEGFGGVIDLTVRTL